MATCHLAQFYHFSSATSYLFESASLTLFHLRLFAVSRVLSFDAFQSLPKELAIVDTRKAGMLIVNIADIAMETVPTAKGPPGPSLLLPITLSSPSQSQGGKKTRPLSLSLSAAKTILQSNFTHKEQSVSSILDDLRTLCCDSNSSDRGLDEGDSLTYSREGDENDPKSAVSQSPLSNPEYVESARTKDLKSSQGLVGRKPSCPASTVNPMDCTASTVLRNNTTGLDSGSYEPYKKATVQKITAVSRKNPVCRSYTESTVHPAVPETKNSEKILQLERVLGYSGGPSLLLYDGKMLVTASGSLLVLIDIQGTAGVASAENPGLWRYFRSFLLGTGSVLFLGRRDSSGSVVTGEEHKDEGEGKGEGDDEGEGGRSARGRDRDRTRALVGCEQAFLRGHTASIGLLEVRSRSVLLTPTIPCLFDVLYIGHG